MIITFANHWLHGRSLGQFYGLSTYPCCLEDTLIDFYIGVVIADVVVLPVIVVGKVLAFVGLLVYV